LAEPGAQRSPPVVAGLVPAIHAFDVAQLSQAWVRATSAGMTVVWERAVSGLIHRHDRLDLDGDVVRQRAEADGRAGVAAGLAEDGDEEVRTAVDDLRVLAEIRHGIDHAEQLHHAPHPAEVAERLVHHGEQVEAGQAGVVIGLLDADLGADLAGALAPVRLARPLAGEEEEVALLHIGHICRDGLRRRRKRKAEIGEALVGGHAVAFCVARVASSAWRMQATEWPGETLSRGGTALAQASIAKGQRVRKTQPDGGSSGLGMSP